MQVAHAARVALATFLVWSLAPRVEAQLSKEDLLAQWESNWQYVGDLEVTFREENSGPPEATEEGLVPAVTCTLRTNGIQYYYETADGDVLNAASYDTFLGEGRRYNNHGSGFGWITSRNQAYAGGTNWLLHVLRPPVEDGEEPWGRYVSLSGMLEEPSSELRAELESVDGRTAAVLDVYYQDQDSGEEDRIMSVWMDVERNAVPLKWQMYDRRTGSPRHTTLLRDYVSIDGCWLPLSMAACVGSGQEFAGLTMQFTVQHDDNGTPSLRINQGLSAEDCTVQFPPRTFVINEDTGESFIARGPSTTEALRGMYAAGMRRKPELDAARADRASVARGARWWAALIVAGALAGGLLRLNWFKGQRA